MTLSRGRKRRGQVDSGLPSRSRRDFLLRCCRGASVTMIPAGLGRSALSQIFPDVFPGVFSNGLVFDSHLLFSSEGEFRLHPRYRSQRPLDALLLKTQAGLDDFVTEKYHDQIATILAEWSASLLRSPLELQTFAKTLAADFSGVPLRATESEVVRGEPTVEVHRNKFNSSLALTRDAFLEELRTSLADYSKFVTAEFQVTAIEALPGSSDLAAQQWRTRVRYEFIGTGSGFYREQRVGYWDLVWKASSEGDFRMQRWDALEETRARSESLVFTDVTVSALGRNSSCSQQLLHGVDYWRTVWTGHRALIFTATTAFRSPISTMTALTISMSVNRRGCRIGSIEIAVMERSKTSQRFLDWGFSTILHAHSLPISTTTEIKTRLL